MTKEGLGMDEGLSAKKKPQALDAHEKLVKGVKGEIEGLRQGDKTKTPDGVEVEVVIVEPHRVVVRFNGTEGIYPRGVLAGDTMTVTKG